MTLSGRSVASPISEIDNEEVFEERIATRRGSSSSRKTVCLMSIRSGAASITKSTSPKPE